MAAGHHATSRDAGVGNPMSGSAVGTATRSLARRRVRVVSPYSNMGAIMLSTLLIVLLILLLLGAIPSWPYSRGWGYGPSGILGIVLIVVLILALTGRV
jgi:hypothetical protein